MIAAIAASARSGQASVMNTIAAAAAALETGRTTARALVETCLERIADPAGEGSRTFLRVYADSARTMADAIDAMRRVGRAPGRYAGIPISLKDLLHVAGEPTPAGSVVLADAPPALAHAAVVQRLLAAGFVPIGRTNMTEFAYSGLGINPHHGTPASPWNRAERHIPGGSSSGAAVSVADGMALGGIGSDTGGSCRIPAAFCGITGFKPTARRVPLAGVLPLAPSLDSIGPLGRSVGCCAVLDAVLAWQDRLPPAPALLSGLRLALPARFALEDAEPVVARIFDRAMARLSAAGVKIERQDFPELDEIPLLNARGGFAAYESFAWHKRLLAAQGGRYDPRVRARIERGAGMNAADQLALTLGRRDLCRRMDSAMAGYDAVLLPTCPILPPRIADLDDEAAYNRANLLALRNPAIANLLDCCAISLPCQAEGEPPVGLMLMAGAMEDARLLAIATGVEAWLAERG